MFQFLSKLTLNQRLALLALVLGVVAIAAVPTRGGRVSIDSREMAALMASDVGRVPARTVARWIIEGRADYRLLDLRDAAAFAAGPRIPSAENVPLVVLADAGLSRADKIVLVADDEARAAQAWFLLRAQGYAGATILKGGLRCWQDEVVNPRVDGLDASARAEAEAVSAHFGGTPRTGEPTGAAGSVASVIPPAQAAAAAPPPPPSGSAKKAAPAKKREGC